MKNILIFGAFSYLVPVLIHAETCMWKQDKPGILGHVTNIYRDIKDVNDKESDQNSRYKILRPD